MIDDFCSEFITWSYLLVLRLRYILGANVQGTSASPSRGVSISSVQLEPSPEAVSILSVHHRTFLFAHEVIDAY